MCATSERIQLPREACWIPSTNLTSLAAMQRDWSGIGASIPFRFVQHFEGPISFHYAHDRQWPHYFLGQVFEAGNASFRGAGTIEAVWPRWRMLLVGTIFDVLLVVDVSYWGWQVDKFALQAPAEDTIHAKSAGCPMWDCGHALPLVISACSGQRRCSFLYNARDFVDKNCSDGFRVEWTRSKGRLLHSLSSPPDPGLGTRIQLSCE
jgi:hypothetical protein